MKEMMINLDKNSNEALYIQLYKYLREEIKSNRIKKGTKLPSIRYLADYLKLSKITVDNAYQQLLIEGYIESRERSGMYVQEIEEMPFNSPKISKMTTSSPLSSNRIKYDFHYGSIDTESFDFNLWRRLTSKALKLSNGDLLQYGDHQGELEFREEIVNYLRLSRGVLCSSSQVIITSGTQNSLQLLCELIDNDDKSIAIEDPGWNISRFIFQKNNFKVTPTPLDKDGICLKTLREASPKFVYVTPSHQFPSGVVMPITRRQNLLKWARDTNAFIIEDDYDSEFRYIGRPIPSLQSLDEDERVIYLGTFSKSLAPSLRISYMVLPKKLLDKYKENMSMYEQPTSRLNQKTLQLFMSNGYWERHVQRMRKIYRKKHNTLIKSIEYYLNDKVRLIGGNAGLHILLEIRNGMPEDMIIQKTEMAGVRIYPTSKYWANNNNLDNPVFLIGFGCLSENQIREGIELLGEVLSNN
ncbi:PLP-dependent aminotransferase family protein [Clostridium cylindrosporum]|uniref:HTH-type transcriptional regulator, GntR family n=1 Tax=Clostridium cylindrosporum DSM 605 TaxID=1121307 RepID=A0A0J8DB61_CLOCY|nr:PLP-dependent aminotransferase family protein [Clostridium cylindrosporum]KMT23315.1 HTH-type transcriptional regulator, GntR family [Clostridium cylindrosporum DSM 605]